MATYEDIKSILTEDIIAEVKSRPVCVDDETYEDYMDSFTEDDPF